MPIAQSGPTESEYRERAIRETALRDAGYREALEAVLEYDDLEELKREARHLLGK